MTIELTPARAIELLREVVAEFGEDYVYPYQDEEDGTCLYVHGDQPGCIAGHVYHRAGLTLEQLKREEHTGADSSDFRILLPGNGTAVVRPAQGAQDNGLTWGEALADAEREYRKLVD